MRPPRIRITTGTLLFVVLIVAVNCAVVRHYFPELADNPYSYISFHDPAHVIVGLLPLLNAAIIRILGLLAQALASFRGRRTHDSHSRLPGFTFLTVHFVALACFTGLVMPMFFESYRASLQPMLSFTEEIWSHLLSEERNHGLWLFLTYAMHALIISGPPLLICWMGGMLANRSVAKLPRPRIIGLSVLVSLGFATAALAVAVTPQPFRKYHDKVELDIQVVDHQTGEPIRGSFLLITDVFSHETEQARALTGSHGRARLTPALVTVGERNSFRAIGTIETWGRWLAISAPGYPTSKMSLTEVFGPTLDLEHPRSGRVLLTRGETKSDSFGNVAGEYGAFQIEPDGRFTYFVRGGCFSAGRMEYGYMSRVGDEFVLKPIREPGREPDSSMTETYRFIPWGEHLYFCSTDADTIDPVCSAALRRIDQQHGMGWTHQRKSDDDKPQPGIPRLPLKFWLRFAIDELNPWAEGGDLNKAIQSLIARKSPDDLPSP